MVRPGGQLIRPVGDQPVPAGEIEGTQGPPAGASFRGRHEGLQSRRPVVLRRKRIHQAQQALVHAAIADDVQPGKTA